MPVSVPVHTKKKQSESDILCDKAEKLLSNVNTALSHIDNLKTLANADNDTLPLLKQALPELASPTPEMKEHYQTFLNEFKHETKTAILQEKKRQKEEKKLRKRKTTSSDDTFSSTLKKNKRKKVKRSRML